MKLNLFKMKFSLGLALTVLCCSMLSLQAHAQGVLRVSAIPDESPTELQRKFLSIAQLLLPTRIKLLLFEFPFMMPMEIVL